MDARFPGWVLRSLCLMRTHSALGKAWVLWVTLGNTEAPAKETPYCQLGSLDSLTRNYLLAGFFLDSFRALQAFYLFCQSSGSVTDRSNKALEARMKRCHRRST